jgi:stage III sporulation protein AB
MIRILGAVMMIFGASAWGILGVVRLRERVRSLSAITAALGIVRCEICERLTPVPELFVMMGKEAQYPASALFRRAERKMSELGIATFPQIWRLAVSETPELLLRPREATALSDLGLTLGRYNADEQRREIDYMKRRFEGFLRDAETERQRDSKMHALLGIAAGVFCVMILL